MPTFEIPDGPTTVDLKRGAGGSATGSVVFNVTNKSSDGCDGRLSVVPSGSAVENWFSVGGSRERAFGAGETQTVTIAVTVPAGIAAGDYPFRLRAVAVNDPDNDHAEGPVATAKVPPPTGPDPKPGIPWWVWLIIGLVALAVVGGGLFMVLKGSGSDKKKPPEHNQPVPPAGRMGVAEMGFDRPGRDIQMGQAVPTLSDCMKMCAANDQCLALTYVFLGPGNTKNGICWIKNAVPNQVANPLMVSAVKIPD